MPYIILKKYKHASSPLVFAWQRSGGPSIVVFRGGAFPNPFFWTGQVGLERFFGVPCLEQGTVEVILIQICSQDMRLVIILWPPRSNINIGLISRNLLDEGPAAKIQLNERQNLLPLSTCCRFNFLGQSLPKGRSIHPVRSHMHLARPQHGRC